MERAQSALDRFRHLTPPDFRPSPFFAISNPSRSKQSTFPDKSLPYMSLSLTVGQLPELWDCRLPFDTVLPIIELAELDDESILAVSHSSQNFRAIALYVIPRARERQMHTFSVSPSAGATPSFESRPVSFELN